MIFDATKRIKRRLDAASGYLMLDLPERALSELDEIDNPVDVSLEFYLLRAEALRAKHDHRRALAAFQKAHELQPNDLGALMGMAWCYKRIDQLNRSIETMRSAYQAHKEVPVVLYNLACYYSLAGEKEQALSWLGRALRMDRGYAKLLLDETDFDSLRDDPDFQHLIELSLK